MLSVAATGPFRVLLPLKRLPSLSFAFSLSICLIWDTTSWAERLKDAGFDGVDLTVRKGGHVLPERVREDLPRAVEAIQSHGLRVAMITTELTSPSDPTAGPILETAARLKIPFFKLGYWRYGKDVIASLRDAGKTCMV